jgi:aryl-alcohol dehydrogenase-like predicted oxidoreductase
VKYREYGQTGWKISEVSFGAWAIGGTWGPVQDEESMAALHQALECGVNFIDTADVYGDGHSERLIKRLRAETTTPFYVVTKAGRRLNPHVADGYTATSLEAFVDRSRENLGMETLDLVQLHCPPTDVYYRPEVFGALEVLKAKGKIQHWGVSVERVEEGLKAMEYAGCQSVQIIFNAFRKRPSELFLEQAKIKKVGVLARLPLSSGMLTGKMTATSTFAPDDHRAFNREGAGFDKGETFSGVPYEVGLEAVEALRPLVPKEMTMAEFALKWILMHDGVTAVIPGGKRAEQVAMNCAASDGLDLGAGVMTAVKSVYDRLIRGHVHDRW